MKHIIVRLEGRKIINSRKRARSRKVKLGLLTVVVAVLAMISLLPRNCQADGYTSTGIGIRIDGPEVAHVNDTIIYVITVTNLGSNYWDRNITVTDTFPNGTSSTWKVPDLAPMGQIGDFFIISDILYKVRKEDVIVNDVSYIDNFAYTSGYVDFQFGIRNPVMAMTSCVTFLKVPVVGGFAVNIETKDASATPPTIYIISIFIAAAALTASGACRRKARAD